ncbi:O-antigen ligase family protein [Micromonospora sp. NPDC004540]|uniref:O-antigen ligase family protein n=1 Tax=Micromonospora sp. NPDC004540 TaxID=3154457 RepID=UPI0033A40C65
MSIPIDLDRPRHLAPRIAPPSGGATAPGTPIAPTSGVGVGALAVAAAGTAGSRVASLLISLAAGILSARSLGPHDRGLLAVSIAAGAVFSTVGAVGLDTANLRLAGRSSGHHRHAFRASIRYALLAGTALAGAWAAAGLLLGPGVRLGLEPATFALALALCPVVLLSALLGSVEIGRGRSAGYNLVVVAALAVYLAGLGGLVVAGRVSALTALAAYGVGQVAGLVALIWRSRPESGDRRVGDVMEYRSSARRAYLPNLAQFGMIRLQVPVIQLLVGASAVGVYSVALSLAEVLLIIPIAVSLVLIPPVANGQADWRSVVRLGGRTLLVTSVGAAALALAAPYVVPLLYGHEFDGAVATVWALLPGVAVFALARVGQSYLTATDRPAATVVAAVAATAVGLAAMAVLVPRLDAVGAGLAGSAGYLVYAAVIAPAFLRADPRRVARRRAAPPRRWRGGGSLPALVGGLGVVAAVGAGLLATRLAEVPMALPTMVAALLLVGVVAAVPATALWGLALAAPAAQLPEPYAVSPVVLLVLSGAAATGALLRQRVTWRDRHCSLLVVALLAVLLLGATVIGPGEGLLASATQVSILAVPLVCLPLAVRDGPSAWSLLLGFAFAATVVGAVQTVTTMRDGAAALLSGTSGEANHNVWGPMLVVALAVLLARWGRPAPVSLRLAILVALPILLLGVGYSYSRSSYLGAAAVVICFALRRLARVGLWLVVTLGVTVAAALPGTGLVPETISTRINETTATGALDVSSGLRLDMWAAALRMTGDFPAFGVGYLNFNERLPEYFIQHVTGGSYQAGPRLGLLAHPHNLYLTVLAETGLIGTALLVALLVLIYRSVWRGYRARTGWVPEAALLGGIGLAVCSLTGEPLLTLPVLIPFVLLLSTATRRPT